MPPKPEKKETVDRSRRRVVEGVVASDKMDKTIKVRVERFVQHPAFGKTLRKHYVCYAHDEKREAKRGDRVELMESRPLSKLKHWRLLKILARASGAVPEDKQAAARPSRVPAADSPSSPART